MWNTITELDAHEESGGGSAVPAVRIGEAIGELRRASGCSLSELARRSGLGKATLSRLEAGNHNATLDTLYAIAGALGLPLAAILSAAGQQRTSGPAIDALLVDSFSAGGCTVETYRLTIQPRRRESPGHVAGTVETLTIVGGEATVGAVGDPQRLSPGETATYRADVRHSYEGIGAAATAVLVISTPAP